MSGRGTGTVRAAVSSIRSRPMTFVAGFVSIFLGAVVVGSFTSLLATGLSSGTSDVDEEALVTMSSVVGGWGLLIVLFSVASTVSVSVHQRAGEIGLMRAIGAVPRQVRRQLLVESFVVGVVACLAAVLPASLVGRWVFGMVQEGGMVSPDLEHRAGLTIILVTSALVLLVSLVAVRLAGHRITGQSAEPDPPQWRAGHGTHAGDVAAAGRRRAPLPGRRGEPVRGHHDGDARPGGPLRGHADRRTGLDPLVVRTRTSLADAPSRCGSGARRPARTLRRIRPPRVVRRPQAQPPAGRDPRAGRGLRRHGPRDALPDGDREPRAVRRGRRRPRG